MLIARLTAQLRCYVPEPVDETWGRLRHLGARREQLIIEAVQPDPADPGAARVRVAGRAGHRAAAVPVQDVGRGDDGDLDRDGGDLARTRRLGLARFEQAVRREITRRGGQKPCAADRPQACSPR